MANRRSDIINALTSHLGQINSVEARNVYSSYRWIDELNDYPVITYVPRREQRLHRGDGRKLALIVISLRGYVYNGDGAMAEVETLAQEIEAKIATFADAARNEQVESALVASVTTDEGLMHPYGVCDLEINITYDVEITT
jgi:hypothetical protein